MKKNFLILTALIYLFSIFAELGIFDSLHLEAQSTLSSQINNLTPSFKNVGGGKKLVGRNSDFSDCTESNCHTGHCHHLSTFNNQSSMGYTELIEVHDYSFGKNYSFQFARGIKRPPRKA